MLDNANQTCVILSHTMQYLAIEAYKVKNGPSPVIMFFNLAKILPHLQRFLPHSQKQFSLISKLYMLATVR